MIWYIKVWVSILQVLHTLCATPHVQIMLEGSKGT